MFKTIQKVKKINFCKYIRYNHTNINNNNIV